MCATRTLLHTCPSTSCEPSFTSRQPHHRQQRPHRMHAAFTSLYPHTSPARPAAGRTYRVTRHCPLGQCSDGARRHRTQAPPLKYARCFVIGKWDDRMHAADMALGKLLLGDDSTDVHTHRRKLEEARKRWKKALKRVQVHAHVNRQPFDARPPLGLVVVPLHLHAACALTHI